MAPINDKPSPSTSSPRQRGQWAEQVASDYLKAQGLYELKRNYRCPCGEIDLILQQQATLVFVEVRYRASSRYGYPQETINARKRRRILKTARHYLQTHPSAARRPCRFDVVTVCGGQEKPEFQWIKGAFDASSYT